MMVNVKVLQVLTLVLQMQFSMALLGSWFRLGTDWNQGIGWTKVFVGSGENCCLLPLCLRTWYQTWSLVHGMLGVVVTSSNVRDGTYLLCQPASTLTVPTCSNSNTEVLVFLLSVSIGLFLVPSRSSCSCHMPTFMHQILLVLWISYFLSLICLCRFKNSHD